MIGLLAVGVVAGVICGISPCILPVLPVVLAAGATETTDETANWWRRHRRAILVVTGLVTGFSIFTLAGTELLSALDLPQDFLRDAGLAVLVLVGLGLLLPSFGQLLERPFTRIRVRPPTRGASGFVLGLGLGAVFVPCAGPVLTAITVIGATHRVGATGVFVTIAFGLGVAIPLLLIALLGAGLATKVAALRTRLRLVQGVAGAVLIVMAGLIGFNLTDGLQRIVPGYTTALQQHVEGTAFAEKQLGALTATGTSALAKCGADTPTLINCGSAPNFKGIAAWLNTNGKALSISGLRGKVVLVDFWTYSCINCQRSLPHVEAWYSRYHADGLEVVGVHTPEFAFEHVVSNIVTAAHQLGVDYPIAVDNDYSTWNTYNNDSWPAEYLIDATGEVRHVALGEGSYDQSETFIRQLLLAANPTIHLPPRTDVADKTPNEEISPETYVGYDRLEYYPGEVTENRAATYKFPPTLPLGDMAFSGVWTDRAEEATAGAMAQLSLAFQAKDVYLVLGGNGTLRIAVKDGTTKTIRISGVPRLYTLFSSPTLWDGNLVLSASPGIEAYDFTFG